MTFRKLSLVLVDVLAQLKIDRAALAAAKIETGAAERRVTAQPVGLSPERKPRPALTLCWSNAKGLTSTHRRKGFPRPVLVRPLVLVGGTDHPTGSSLARYARSQRLQ